jgi:hypothetical protein
MRAAAVSIIAVFLVFLGAPDASALGPAVRGDATPDHTQRRVQGVITAVAPQSLTIDCSQTKRGVTGKLGAATRVTLNGKAARLQDLEVAQEARGEMGLDDAWIAVAATTRL